MYYTLCTTSEKTVCVLCWTGLAVCVFFYSSLCDRSFACISEALCVCIFHHSPGVCRAVRSFSLSLYIIHSLLALCMRGTVCVYFIGRSGYVGLFVHFRLFFLLFIHCSRCVCGALCVSISLLARGMSGCSFIFAFTLYYSFIARIVYARQCLCIFYFSLGVCRPVPVCIFSYTNLCFWHLNRSYAGNVCAI